MKPPKPVYSTVAAVILAVVTFFTFYVFRDFGPQSVLRRFHIAVARRDVGELRRVTLAPDDPATQAMVRFVQERIRSNATFEIVGMTRERSAMLVVVEYRWPTRPNWVQVIVWHVRQTARDWRVDCQATARGILGYREPLSGFSG